MREQLLRSVMFTLLIATSIANVDLSSQNQEPKPEIRILLPTTSSSSSSQSRRTRGDDLSLNELNVLLQNQAQSIQELQSQLEGEKAQRQSLENSLENLNQLVTDLKSNNHDIEAQLTAVTSRLSDSNKAVGFSARFGHDGGQMTGVALGDHSTLVFDSVLDNTGGAYDPHTGVFTAPVSGLYSFFLTQMTADNRPQLWLSIMKDGQYLDKIYTEGGHGTNGDTHDQGASQVVTHLTAGQKVWVRHESGGAVRGGWFTVFTGYLIQAD